MFVSITRLRLRSVRYLLPFIVHAMRSSRQAKRAAGRVVADTWRDKHGAYWTRTVWTDEAAMRAFMMSGAHRKAMPRLLEWCDEAAVAHWEQESATPPAWPDAHRRLLAEGRRSKVRYPSPGHDAFTFPAPL
jgi:hypothetical protein